MDISVTPEQAQLVHRLVDSGRYKSASEVIGEALRLVDVRDRLEGVGRSDVEAGIAAGVASLRAGRTVDGEAVFDRLDSEIDAEERRTSR